MPEQEQATDAPWYADGLKFKCTQCGNCCTGPPGFVWFDEEEAIAIADHLGLSVDEFHKRYCKKKYGRWTLDEVSRKHGFDCIFLRRDEQGRGLCSIYPVRPTQCRTWPFWPENLRSPRAWRRASRHCPGIDHGNFYPAEEIRILVDKNPDAL